MKIEIRKAERKRSYLRLALCGVSGSGKTYSSLLVAAGMGQKILFIDSEQGSSNLYSDLIPQGFDVLEMSSHHPKDYIAAIAAGVRHGADVIVIDSLSHAWMGKDGALELVDAAQGNKFAAWRTVTPLHNALVDAILTAPCHIIATMRSKSEWVLETNAKGKQEPRKVGLAPIQRDGIEYEFTCVGDISLDHVLTWSKTRIAELDGRPIRNPDQKLGAQLRAWVQGGKASESEPHPKVVAAVETIGAALGASTEGAWARGRAWLDDALGPGWLPPLGECWAEPRLRALRACVATLRVGAAGGVEQMDAAMDAAAHDLGEAWG